MVLVVLMFLPGFAFGDDRNLLPKYGSLPKAEWQKAADEKLIAAIDEEYKGDRKRASTEMAARGWQNLTGGNFEDAMRRFNQAWLLDKNNGRALWGMAAIQASLSKFDNALKLLSEADKLLDGDINFSIDQAKVLAMAGVSANNKGLLKEAYERFERIYKKAPQNTKNLQNWAITLFSTGKYSEAWSKVKLAEATPEKVELDSSFLAALESRMPRPKD
jgi:tetratricopeptide (TPR) repeat protein